MTTFGVTACVGLDEYIFVRLGSQCGIGNACIDEKSCVLTPPSTHENVRETSGRVVDSMELLTSPSTQENVRMTSGRVVDSMESMELYTSPSTQERPGDLRASG